jgi:hypothetical protein
VVLSDTQRLVGELQRTYACEYEAESQCPAENRRK